MEQDIHSRRLRKLGLLPSAQRRESDLLPAVCLGAIARNARTAGLNETSQIVQLLVYLIDLPVTRVR